MAETRKITVEIITTPKEKKEKKDFETSNLSELLHPAKSLEKELLGKNVFINQAYNQAKSLIMNTVNTSINQYFNLSEDYLGQNTYKEITKTLSKAQSLGSSIVSGFIVGGGVGAAIGAVGWTANEIISNQARMSNYYSSLNTTNYGTGFSRTRAGLVDNGRGTEN